VLRALHLVAHHWSIVKVDHLIIGAGLAGLVLKRALNPALRTVIVDPSPGSWKIGEANVPEMFSNPVLGELLETAKALPSYSRKNGSMFIGADSAAIYPIVSNPEAAVHVARDELEHALLEAWEIPVAVERVQEIDLARKIVVTDKTTYEVAGQILDCSGAAMLVARALNEVQSLWPIHSSWRYYDVLADEPDRFWEFLQETGRSWLAIDIPRLRLLPLAPDWLPGQATTLTRVRDGVWLWQIALFRGKLLSAGVVSRHGPVSEADLDQIVSDFHARNYTLRPHPVGGTTPYDRFHQRSGFALRASRAATKDYILIGDAFMFVDPIYSVGTSIAVNKALEAAAFLNRSAWNEKNIEGFCQRYERLIQQRTAAFRYWYSEEHLYADENTARVRQVFPQMTPFQAGISWRYAEVVNATLNLTSAVRRVHGVATPKHFEADPYGPSAPLRP
jgi:flavin-dependent dehydrogenase